MPRRRPPAELPSPPWRQPRRRPRQAEKITIEAFDLGFKPSMPTVPAAGTYEVEFKNTGSTLHDVTFADGTKLSAEGGKSATGTVTVPAAGLAFLCSIPGHADAGMKGEVMVAGAAPAATPAPVAGGTSTAPVADPNAPKYTLFDATAPKLLAGTVHDVDFPIIDKDITVAEGFVVKTWTFGGQVPGPTLRVHLGDTVNVHLTNKSSMSHSIDFHASQTAMNHQMVEIAPGATFTYTFTADYAGVWMYHCGTAPALHHIANGMFGMVIVEPKGGLPKVDEEIALVQSEWYLGAQKQPVDYAKANAAAPAPDFVVFNGVANQYKDNPIQVTTKGRVRVFVLDVGPEHRQLVPRRRHDLRHGHQGGRHPGQGQCRRLGQPGGRPLARPRARSSSSARRKTGCIRWSPTPSTSSAAAPSASSWPATATRRTDPMTGPSTTHHRAGSRVGSLLRRLRGGVGHSAESAARRRDPSERRPSRREPSWSCSSRMCDGRSHDRRTVGSRWPVCWSARAFLAAALVAAILPESIRRGVWLPVHLALAGAAGTAIASVLPFFVAALSVAPPMSGIVRGGAIGLIAGGAAAASLGVAGGIEPLALAGALGYLAGLGGVAVAAFWPLRASRGPRRRLVVAAYGAAIAQVALGVVLVIAMLAGVPPIVEGWALLKPAHAWLNVFGFLSVVIAATLVHLAPTVAGTRIVPRRSARLALAGLAIGAPLIALGFALGDDRIARIGALAELLGAIGLMAHALAIRHDRGTWTTDPGWHRMTAWSLLAAPAWFLVAVAISRRPDPLARRGAGRLVARQHRGAACGRLGRPGPHRRVEPIAPVDRPGRHGRSRPPTGPFGSCRHRAGDALNLGVALVTLGGLLAVDGCGRHRPDRLRRRDPDVSLAIFVDAARTGRVPAGVAPAGPAIVGRLTDATGADQTRRLCDQGRPGVVPGSRRRAAERAPHRG